MSKAKTPATGFHQLADMGDRVLVSSLYDPEVEDGAFICNFDPHDPANMGLVFLASKPSTEATEDMLGKEFAVRHWVCQKQTLPGRNGEAPSKVVRTTIIDETGNTYSSASKGVAKSIDVLRQFYPDTPYDPAVHMTLVGSDIGKGADFLQLIPSSALKRS